LVGNTTQTCNGSGAAEVGGDDAVVSLGTLLSTTVDGVTHNRGSRDQQAGTFLHEFGHLLGFEHGGFDTVNCKPNYLSVMNYTLQFNGSPTSNRRLDYSRATLPDLNETAALNETLGLGAGTVFEGVTLDTVLGPIPPFYPFAAQTAYGPTAWSLAGANTKPINWDRSKQGPNPSITTNASANINQGPTSGCDGAGTLLESHNDWANVLYRFTAAVDASGGVRTEAPQEMTQADEAKFYAARDADGNGVGDNEDCGGQVGTSTFFSCVHRIDIKPSSPLPKVLTLGDNATLTVAIFSEKSGSKVWNATQIILNDMANFPLTFTIDNYTTNVKVNSFGQGTCSVSDIEDPVTHKKDALKDYKCQFPLIPEISLGTNYGIVSGYFRDTVTNEVRGFTARQEVTVLP
jgi:hypothetical protein